MIPKVIHYCWFGQGKKPDSVIKYINTWKKVMPDYEIKEWNEENFDMDAFPYAKEAYSQKKYAFVSDVVRLYALYHEGGVYLDTDIEVLKTFDPFLEHPAFIGFEDQNNIQTGLIASEKGGPWVKEALDLYEGRHFILPDGTLDTTTNVTLLTGMMEKHGLLKDNSRQDLKDLISIYPSDYFCAKSYSDGKVTVTDRTVTIHHFSGSWLTPMGRFKVYRAQLIKRYNLTALKNFIKRFINK